MIIYQSQDALIFFQLTGIKSEFVAGREGLSAVKMRRNKNAILKKLLSIIVKNPWRTCGSFFKNTVFLKNSFEYMHKKGIHEPSHT